MFRRKEEFQWHIYLAIELEHESFQLRAKHHESSGLLTEFKPNANTYIVQKFALLGKICLHTLDSPSSWIHYAKIHL